MIKREFRNFFIVGVGSNIINYSSYLATYFFIENIIFASAVGYFAGLINSFYFGKSWVFKKKNKIMFTEVFLFLLVYLVGGILMSSIIWSLSEVAAIDYRISWFVGSITAMLNNFFGSKYIVFKL